MNNGFKAAVALGLLPYDSSLFCDRVSHLFAVARGEL